MNFFKTITILAVLFGVATAHGSKPNVVVFLVDDLGWMDLSCQGSDYFNTPHTNGLAASGVRFTNAYAACAVCSPTRAAILTGKYPARLMLTQWLPAGRWNAEKHRMKEGRFLRSLPLEEVTLAETLREEGYTTFHVGKWHLGGKPFSLPQHHRFDHNVAGDDHGAPGSFFYPFKGSWTIPTTGLKAKKQAYDGGKPGDYLTDLIGEAAAKLIRDHKDKPFFLYLPFYGVHTPLQGKPDKVKRYGKVPAAQRQGKPHYAAMVESMDEAVGHVMSTLKELGIADDTLVIFTSDNGGFAGATDNSPLRANKGSHYEGGIRVPLIVAGAGVCTKGTVSDFPVTSSDLYPTILEMLALESRPEQHLDGVSLAGILKGSSKPERESLFWHYPHYNRHPSSAPVSIIRAGNWKFIEFLESGKSELYNLEEDQGESRNLTKEQPKVAADLSSKLEAWRIEVGAYPMKPNLQYRRNED